MHLFRTAVVLFPSLPISLSLPPLFSCCLLVWFKYLQRSERFSTSNFYEHFDDFDFTKSIFTHWPRPPPLTPPLCYVCTLGHSLLDVQLTKINRISDSDSVSIAGTGPHKPLSTKLLIRQVEPIENGQLHFSILNWKADKLPGRQAQTAGNWVSLCSIFLLPHKPLLLYFCSGYFSAVVFSRFFFSARCHFQFG